MRFGRTAQFCLALVLRAKSPCDWPKWQVGVGDCDKVEEQ